MMDTNTDIQNVFMTLRFEIYHHSFTPEQIIKLSHIINKTNDIDFKLSNPFKLALNIKKTIKILKEFENTFKSFGGDVDALETKLKIMKSQKIKAYSELLRMK